MLRTLSGARALGPGDFPAALDLCAVDPLANVFVAARLIEGGPSYAGALLGTDDGRRLRSMCWTSANVVPIGADEAALDAFASRLRRKRRRCSSIFGDADQVLGLWARLERHWGDARSVRPDQPMMAVSAVPAKGSGPVDARVRRARLDEVDQVLPASAAMFTEEIGYPPYIGSDREYRRMVTSLVSAGHTFVVTEGHEVIFKADVGSLAAGVAQLQGVWVAPKHRGKGMATPAMRAVVRQVIETIAPTVTLYVNAYNEPALRTYHSAGFRQVGKFATVIL
ncbi:MAG TPA: GNAT family N-acetyltransferase [Flexivirga sp.]|uniref:GNAT family N-acetyltransferase n=1 Tax=Flexivirga sp. TaxID=1962927 RepID=UPI002C6442A5|nr:GNAT family N-acetyltransferase [Flexivirga sp.]HWC23121.1 GNAT family N-acetyltransferase [Flexivirga sp.]